MDEYKIRYNYDKNKHVGKVTETVKLGMSLHVMDLLEMVKKDQGKVKEQGTRLEKIILKQKCLLWIWKKLYCNKLELPNLKRKELMKTVIEHIEFNDIRKTGLMGNIDKKTNDDVRL